LARLAARISVSRHHVASFPFAAPCTSASSAAVIRSSSRSVCSSSFGLGGRPMRLAFMPLFYGKKVLTQGFTGRLIYRKISTDKKPRRSLGGPRRGQTKSSFRPIPP
jgi:hypothetical protein